MSQSPWTVFNPLLYRATSSILMAHCDMLGVSLQTYCEEKGKHEFSGDCSTRFGQRKCNSALQKTLPLTHSLQKEEITDECKTHKTKLI